MVHIIKRYNEYIFLVFTLDRIKSSTLGIINLTVFFKHAAECRLNLTALLFSLSNVVGNN